MTTTELAPRNGAIAQTLEQVLIQGDLSPLSTAQRVQYYHEVCHSLGLNEATRPFEYLVLGKGKEQKLVLYARKDCTEQLRKLHGVSITGLETGRVGDLFIATAHARDTSGREDTDMGAVPVAKPGGSWEGPQDARRFKADGTSVDLTGDDLANAMLKAVTKAKRRVTLSLCGLGMLDESEVEAIPGARTVAEDVTVQPPPVNVQAPQRTHEEVFPDSDDSPQPTRMATVRSRLGQGYAELVEEAARLDVPFETIAYPVPESTVIEKGKALRAAIEAKKAALANPSTVAEMDALAF